MGENSCSKEAIEFLSCLQTALLSACYDKIIFKAKQVCLFREFVLEKRPARRSAIYLDLQVQNQLFVNLHTPHVQFMKRKR